MAGEFFRTKKITALVCIRLADLQSAIPSAVYSAIQPLLVQHTINEPLTIELYDLGYRDPRSTPLTVDLSASAVQVDAGENEIPRATCMLAVGRDGGSLASGMSNLGATSVAHVLERYLSGHVPVRIFERTLTPSGAGVGDYADNSDDGGEWKILFEGFATGPTRRGTAESSEFVLHASHFLGRLAFSSSLSGDVMAGSEFPAAFHTSVLQNFLPGAVTGLTPYGVLCASLAGGDAAQKDFWGFNVPPGDATQFPACGLKSFLYGLSENNQFDWQGLRQADRGATNCRPAFPLANDGAKAALDRIEPFLPNWLEVAGGGPGPAHAFASRVWTEIASTVTSVRNGRETAGSFVGVDRSDLLAGAPRAYTVSGYRYGVPITFRLSGQFLGPFTPGRGFASDIAGATFGDLYAASFWELIAGRYQARYSLSLVPMATRALVVPYAPLLSGIWQLVYASEISQWEDDVSNPLPIRGVILISDRKSTTGVFHVGNPAAGAAAPAFQQMDAVYDSCQPGAFITRGMPNWLSDAYRLPSIYAANTLRNMPRALSSVPWVLGPGALAAAAQIAAATNGAANPAAVGAPPASSLTTAARMAKAIYQNERTKTRTAYITGRYRTDIAPGSIVRFELPADKYVRAAVGGNRDTTVVGRVIRVTMSIDAERETAQTAFAVSHLRTEAEVDVPTNPLYSEGHPFWSTLSLGAPWCDSLYMRNKLGVRANIVDEPLGGGR